MFDKLPLASLVGISGIVLAIIGYITGDLTILEAGAFAGITNTGAGVLGHARNGAGRGVRE